MTDLPTPPAPVPERRLAVLGTGIMGETVLAGALAAGWDPADVVATVRRAERGEELAARHGVATTQDNVEAVRGAGVVVVAVKPKDVAALLAEVRDAVGAGTVVVSVVVGLPTSFYEDRLPAGTAVVRVMPNTPSVVGAGVSAVSGGAAADDGDVALVERLLSATGLVVRVAEKDQDAVGALSGSGPAYVFYVIDALAEAGVLLGLTRATALELATATVHGAATMLRETGEHPAIAREKVSSPGGTTVAALRRLDAGGVRAAFLDALEAARDRSAELAAALADAPTPRPEAGRDER
ncbi:pyrroline-5-carboxylate reductase [Cellulosimicrobium sp. I38E]|uniref:pyrroline-5-carboxylate reductase n=1 Tax=Cellulosimicrobium sp. I38E TaxID=1393139 RepID=UPI0007B1C30C|nr:pyrroline-5-carboxylate reductase [Cellulosimicrobium sp. I38E]KZM78289.1 pyrroline-5-carboxylate reductase [Cellulosimicrobium sp. I38E]